MRTQSDGGSQTGLAGANWYTRKTGHAVKLKVNMPGDRAISLSGINPKRKCVLVHEEVLL